ncbi:phosphonate metabolism transcriptional regulator PhnF (plasmid) [Peteryoungia desertarenae]|uniref:Phosphonate metabolism transcriptional regulator PhnF n=1 Tax=Peteryoungia desertarenae TaxID=1813451 RepID=A0ABX6QTK8_9HYPH|nr:phosphonate metabolism transcriptional regulator PhnF [Peteryoungia desertarenae]QLF71870.1 phosphonate metabolism transcriptional regulator PhnF [Peteryoungia desertarenae]
MLQTPEIPIATFEGLVFGPRSDMPIWQQIRDHILGLIENGTLRSGSQLPGETHLAARLGVTRITLRQALQHLQNEGHLTARKGVGIFVRSPPAIFTVRDGHPFHENIETHSEPITTDTRFVRREPASTQLAARLRIPGGANIIHLRRLRLLGEQPVYVNDKYFPADRFPDFEALYAERQSVTDVFRAAGIAAFRRVETRISGGFSSADEADNLRLTPGTPVFHLNARNEDGNGRTIEWTSGCWPLTSVEFVFGAPEK